MDHYAVFFTQCFALLIIISASIYNLTWGEYHHQNLWISLLSSSLGVILPNPKLKEKKDNDDEEAIDFDVPDRLGSISHHVTN